MAVEPALFNKAAAPEIGARIVKDEIGTRVDDGPAIGSEFILELARRPAGIT